MTSTEFNVGLGDDGRCSSRVLKPPGGGHTNIFGGENGSEKPKHLRAHQSSEIKGCFHFDNEQKNSKEEQKKGEKAVTEKKTEQQTISSSSPSPPQRVRVPPGGFSSGLW